MILREILNKLEQDAPVKEVRVGPFWTAVWSRYCGMASTVFECEHNSTLPVREAGRLTYKTAQELGEYAWSDSLLERSIGLAAINSLLEIEEDTGQEINAADVLMQHGKGRKICIVGHFPFVPKLQQAAKKLWVLEKRPRLDDLPAQQASRVLPEAEVVAITGTALLNGTMERLLSLCRKEAMVMVLGPTTPLSPVWFAHGVNLVSGTRVTEPETVLKLVSQGIIFSQFKKRGVKLLTMAEKGLAR